MVCVCQAVEEVLLFNRQHFLATHLSKAARKAKDTFDGEAIIYHIIIPEKKLTYHMECGCAVWLLQRRSAVPSWPACPCRPRHW